MKLRLRVVKVYKDTWFGRRLDSIEETFEVKEGNKWVPIEVIEEERVIL